MDEHGLDHLAVIEPHREADGAVGGGDDLCRRQSEGRVQLRE